MEFTLRARVRQRAGGRCEYCRISEDDLDLPFEIDHVIATKHHGPTRLGNLCYACFACNNHKGSNISGFDIVTKNVVALFHPRRQKWSFHFRWDGPILVGRSAVGRTTVDVLAINLSYRVELRQALIDAGLFPPE